jgi:hypothetical protein
MSRHENPPMVRPDGHASAASPMGSVAGLWDASGGFIEEHYTTFSIG